MKFTRFILVSLLIISIYSSFGQTTKINKVNTSVAEAYFEVAEALKSGIYENSTAWQKLFASQIYQMMISGGGIDTVTLKTEMMHVFDPSAPLSQAEVSRSELYHRLYKENKTELENYITLLKKSNIEDSVKNILYPYLPFRLQSDSFFPAVYYLNYGAPEANGYGGIVINDLLFSYRIDNYKFGLVTAHEAFHSIVSVAFQKRLKESLDYDAIDFNLMYFLQNVSEEGIADLIDKPLLLKRGSPVYDEVKQLTKDDEVLSIQYIKSIDSLLKLSFTSDQMLQQYNGFTDLANTYGRNGGHIPGRFMGNIIQKSGLLEKHIKNVEDPISFILTYNEAAKKLGEKNPLFSKESIGYIQLIKKKYFQD